jgi:hypothetical protein
MNRDNERRQPGRGRPPGGQASSAGPVFDPQWVPAPPPTVDGGPAPTDSRRGNHRHGSNSAGEGAPKRNTHAMDYGGGMILTGDGTEHRVARIG